MSSQGGVWGCVASMNAWEPNERLGATQRRVDWVADSGVVRPGGSGWLAVDCEAAQESRDDRPGEPESLPSEPTSFSCEGRAVSLANAQLANEITRGQGHLCDVHAARVAMDSVGIAGTIATRMRFNPGCLMTRIGRMLGFALSAFVKPGIVFSSLCAILF